MKKKQVTLTFEEDELQALEALVGKVPMGSRHGTLKWWLLLGASCASNIPVLEALDQFKKFNDLPAAERYKL